eukprot:915279-Rhodomonas_salina.2
MDATSHVLAGQTTADASRHFAVLVMVSRMRWAVGGCDLRDILSLHRQPLLQPDHDSLPPIDRLVSASLQDSFHAKHHSREMVPRDLSRGADSQAALTTLATEPTTANARHVRAGGARTWSMMEANLVASASKPAPPPNPAPRHNHTDPRTCRV